MNINQPKISAGIIDRQDEVAGCLQGTFHGNGFGPVSGRFSAKALAGLVLLRDEAGKEIARLPSIRLTGGEISTFELFQVTIGTRFHWERKEDQTFAGALRLIAAPDGTMSAVNDIGVEQYLKSVISSEMSAEAPEELLRAHVHYLAQLACRHARTRTARQCVGRTRDAIEGIGRRNRPMV